MENETGVDVCKLEPWGRSPASKSPGVCVEVQVPGPHFRSAGSHSGWAEESAFPPRSPVCCRGPAALALSGSGSEAQNPGPPRDRSRIQFDKIPGTADMPMLRNTLSSRAPRTQLTQSAWAGPRVCISNKLPGDAEATSVPDVSCKKHCAL